MNKIPQYITVKKAAEITMFTIETIRRWIRTDPKFPKVVIIHNKIRIPLDTFLDYFERDKV